MTNDERLQDSDSREAFTEYKKTRLPLMSEEAKKILREMDREVFGENNSNKNP